MRKRFGQEALLDVLRQDWRNLKYWGLERRKTGVFLSPLDSHLASLLTDEEREAVLAHPAKDRDKPALPFPFTLNEFLAFSECYGLAQLWQLPGEDNGTGIVPGVPDKQGIEALTRSSPQAAELVRAMLHIPTPDNKTGPARPEPRQEMQEDFILEALRKGGYDPRALPPRAPGKAGLKAQVRTAASIPSPLFQSANVLDKAWERLKSKKLIQEG